MFQIFQIFQSNLRRAKAMTMPGRTISPSPSIAIGLGASGAARLSTGLGKRSLIGRSSLVATVTINGV